MYKKTVERLKAAGWFIERKININLFKQKYSEIGLIMPDNVENFLENYGMLKVDAPDKNYFDVEFNPIKAIGINFDGEYFKECLLEYEISDMVYPIGMACREAIIME